MVTGSEPGKQALKARRTRERIINAVIELITQGGFGAASSSQIARTAGVTWGAVQHHFGAKDDILVAVLERSHERFTELMQRDALIQGTLADRVDLFVDLIWEHYQSDLYLAALEILLATRQRVERSSDSASASLIREQSRSHLQTMRRIFSDLERSDEQHLEALVFTHTFLTGLTIERVFEHGRGNEARHLSRIKSALLSMLAPDEAARAGVASSS